MHIEVEDNSKYLLGKPQWDVWLFLQLGYLTVSYPVKKDPKPDVVTHACNFSTWEAETREFP